MSISLPQPLELLSDVSLATALENRHSHRLRHSSSPLSLQHISAILFSGQGQNSKNHHRTTPSAGALYPLELYAAVKGNATELVDDAVFHYQPRYHSLVRVPGIHSAHARLVESAGDEEWMQNSACIVVIVGTDRLQEKYGCRSTRYLTAEAGAAMQNMLLAASAMGLAATPVGAFRDEDAACAINTSCQPMLLVAFGQSA